MTSTVWTIHHVIEAVDAGGVVAVSPRMNIAPFFVALFSAGFETTFYLALREYGFPTAAAVNFLVVGIAATIRPQRLSLRKRPFAAQASATTS